MINCQKNAKPLAFPLPTSEPDSPKARVGKVHRTLTTFPAMVRSKREGDEVPESPPVSPCEPSTASHPSPQPWEAQRLEMGTFQTSQTSNRRPGKAAVRPARVESRYPRVTATVGPRGRGPGRSERRRSPVGRLPRRSVGRFRRAAPGAGEAGLGAAAPRRPSRPGAPLHARTAGASPPRAARPTDRTHLAAPTPTPTPSARAEEVAAAGRRPKLHLRPREPGADGGS